MNKLQELRDKKQNHECKELGGTCTWCEDINAEIYALEQIVDAQVDQEIEDQYHNHMR